MKIFVSAGEVSGDVHGAYLVRELKKLSPALSFFGVGSDHLAAAGVDIRFDISRRGTIGLLEALPNIFPLLSVFSRVKALLIREKPDLAILIDSQGFNLPLARFCRKNNIKTVYYIAPQEWLWGTQRGVKKVARELDLIVAIFEKEYLAYKVAGANVIYHGHPLQDIVRSSGQPLPFRGLTRPIISLCPGSRLQEIRNVFPDILKAALLIREKHPQASFLVPAASPSLLKELAAMVRDLPNFHLLCGRTYDLLSASDLAICTSGTVNLEAALLGVPNIMVYRLSPLTFFIGKYLLRIDKKLKYFSLPNLLLDEKLVPELVMGGATAKSIYQESLSLLSDQPLREKTKAGFSRLKTLLGRPGAIKFAAAEILRSF